MMSKTKWLSIVLTLCLIVSSIVVVSATGETAPLAAEAEKDGIQVSLTTDKDTYAAGEAILVALRVGNSTASNIANVQTKITIPASLSVALGSLDKTIDELGAAQLGQNKLYIGLGNVELPPDADISDGTGEGGDGVGSDPEVTPDDGKDDDTTTPDVTEEKEDNNVLLIVAIVVLVASAGGLVFATVLALAEGLIRGLLG